MYFNGQCTFTEMFVLFVCSIFHIIIALFIQGIKWVFLPCRLNDYHYISEVVKGTNPKQKLKAQAEDVRLLHPDFVRYVHKV